MSSNLKKYSISDAAEVLTGFPFKGEKYTNTGIRVVRGENVTILDLRWDTVKCWNEPFSEIEKYSLSEGDIVIGMDGSRVGRNRAQIKESDLPLLLAQRVARLRAKKNFSQDYLAYIIKSKAFEKYVEAIKTGTSIPHISPQQIKEFEFDAPDYKKQEFIASILSSLDKKIENNKKINQDLETFSQILFNEKCLHPLNSPPDGWETFRIGDLLETVSETYKFGTKEKIIFLNTGDISNGLFLHSDYSIVSNLPGQAKKKIRLNDILFSEIRPENKRFAFVDFEADDYVVSTKLMVLRSKKLSPVFLYFYLTRNEIIKQLQHLAESRSGTFPQITFSQLSNIEIILPPKKILDEFIKILESNFQLIKTNEKQTQTLTDIRDSLLPKLMKGEINI